MPAVETLHAHGVVAAPGIEDGRIAEAAGYAFRQRQKPGADKGGDVHARADEAGIPDVVFLGGRVAGHKIFLAQHRQQPVDGGNGDIEGRAQLFGGYHAVAAEDHLFQNVQHAIDALRAFDGLLVGIHNHSCRLKVADTMRRWKKAAKRKRAAPVWDGV